MSTLRNDKVEEIKDVFDYQPNIPDNWYMPAKYVWTSLVWCIKKLQKYKYFKNNEQANEQMDVFERMIENLSIAFKEEIENENTSSN